MSMWLDRETGAKCYMLSVRALHISSGHIARYWDWIPLPDSCRLVLPQCTFLGYFSCIYFRFYLLNQNAELNDVQAIPRIYELLPRCSGLMYEDPFFNWFRDDTYEQWTATIYFTPLSIGQSSILYLEVQQQYYRFIA